MDVLTNPNTTIHQAKKILGYKNVSEMIRTLKPTNARYARFSSSTRLNYLEYDSDGFAKPVFEGDRFDIRSRVNDVDITKYKKYNTKLILEKLRNFNEVNCKDFLEKLQVYQPNMIKTMLSAKNSVKLFEFIVNRNKLSTARFIANYLATFPRDRRHVAALKGFTTANIALHKILRDLIEIKYEKNESEMRWIESPDDCEFAHNIHYLWLNENFDVVKHYYETFDEEVILDSLERLNGFSDAGFYHIHNYLTKDTACKYRRLTFKGNIMRCFQIMYGKNICNATQVLQYKDRSIISECFPELNLNNYNHHQRIIYYDADYIRESRIMENFAFNFMGERDYFLSAVLYKIIKNSPNCCVSSHNLIQILQTFITIDNDFYIQSIEMLFGNFFCVIDSKLLQFICESKNHDSPYIRIALGSIDSKAAKVHECKNENCPFRMSKRSKR